MKFFKKLALVAALAAAGTCSAATSFDEGTGTDITLSSAGEYTFAGSFLAWTEDTWTFDLAPGYVLSLFVSAEIDNYYHVELDGEDRGRQYTFEVDLSSGKHTLTLSQPGWQSTYNGLLAVTAVPEPETYAMFLAGLGIMGALARRRKPA